jgi:hypothetical protein
LFEIWWFLYILTTVIKIFFAVCGFSGEDKKKEEEEEEEGVFALILSYVFRTKRKKKHTYSTPPFSPSLGHHSVHARKEERKKEEKWFR